MANGRGAWTTTGKDNGVVFYQLVAGRPLDGSAPDRDAAHEAVHFGVLAIQRRLNQLIAAAPTAKTHTVVAGDTMWAIAYANHTTVAALVELNKAAYPSLVTNPGAIQIGWVFKLEPGTGVPAQVTSGQYDAATEKAVAWAAPQLGVSSGTPPRVGSAYGQALWRPMIGFAAAKNSINASWIFGLMRQESAADPGAVGYFNEHDLGLVQINLQAHPNITKEMAFDPAFSLDWCAKVTSDNATAFAGKGSTLQRNCAIAAWNNPAKARAWYAAGVAPDSQINTYVTNVVNFAAGW